MDENEAVRDTLTVFTLYKHPRSQTIFKMHHFYFQQLNNQHFVQYNALYTLAPHWLIFIPVKN